MQRASLVLLSLLPGCASTIPAWGYDELSGPAAWGKLHDSWSLCGTGHGQSPVDITETSLGAAEPLTVDWRPLPLAPENDGHHVALPAPPEGAGSIGLGARRFTLRGFHAHGPSEHSVDGESFPLELHFVHTGAGGELAVVSLFLTQGAENAALAPLAAHLPHAAGTGIKVGDETFDPLALLPAERGTWRYAGSLTSPPCTEGVSWVILRQPVEASQEQIDAFDGVFSNNRRPQQPLHGRTVVESP